MSNMDYTNNDNSINNDNNFNNNNDNNNYNNYTYGVDSEIFANYEKKAAEANALNDEIANEQNNEQMSSMSWEGKGTVDVDVVSTKTKKDKKTKSCKGSVAVSVVTIAISVVLSAVIGFGGGWIGANINSDMHEKNEKSETKIVKQVVAEDDIDETLTTESIVKAVEDSVVEITTESVETGTFFGQYIASGAGSGIVISSDGYIATNDHVISGANKVTVRLRNGEEYEAKLVGTDATTDIALLKIEAENLQPAVFGDSDDLSVGEKAVVIGNPLGELGGTVSCGIISAVDREVNIDGQKKNLLQTDAAVNPGNSGGPLFDGKGNVVGMVEAKSTGDDVEGIGFVIPANTVVDILEELKKNGHVTGRPYLGITMFDAATLQEAYQKGVTHLGTYIESVVPGSAAEKYGLKAGDCIIKVDGKEVANFSDVKEIVSQKKVGDKIVISVLRIENREEKAMDVEVVLGEQNNTEESSIDKYKNE